MTACGSCECTDAGRRCPACLRSPSERALQARDEEFAQFVFAHFGGYWMQRNPLPNEEEVMRKLPARIATRVTELAREFELKRGGP